MIDLSIVIPVFNNVNFTKACLNDLAKLPNNHEIVIVDNGSTDNTREVCFDIQEVLLQSNNNGLNVPQLRYFQNSKNLGFAKACNIGFQQSLGANVLFLNNDIRVQSNHSDWTSKLIELSKDFIVGPNGGLVDGNANFIRETDKIMEGNFYMSGWCISSSKAIWNKLKIADNCGPFSEEFGLAYYEDSDLGLRASELGIKLKIHSVPVVHFGRMTSKKVGMSKLYPVAQEIFRNKWKEKLRK